MILNVASNRTDAPTDMQGARACSDVGSAGSGARAHRAAARIARLRAGALGRLCREQACGTQGPARVSRDAAGRTWLGSECGVGRLGRALGAGRRARWRRAVGAARPRSGALGAGRPGRRARCPGGLLVRA
jgi:hypothetical protein